MDPAVAPRREMGEQTVARGEQLRRTVIVTAGTAGIMRTQAARCQEAERDDE